MSTRLQLFFNLKKSPNAYIKLPCYLKFRIQEIIPMVPSAKLLENNLAKVVKMLTTNTKFLNLFLKSDSIGGKIKTKK